jgi:hypothetical protein
VLQQLEIDGSSHQEVAVGIWVSMISELENRIHDVRIRWVLHNGVEVNHRVESRLMKESLLSERLM